MVREWVTVLCVGGGGGALAAIFSLWLRFERGPNGANPRLKTWSYWVLSALVNGFAGAVVGFFLWATYTGADMSSTAAPPGVIAATIAVGVGGVSAVQRFLYVEENQKEAVETVTEGAENVLEAAGIASETIDQVRDDVHNSKGGDET